MCNSGVGRVTEMRRKYREVKQLVKKKSFVILFVFWALKEWSLFFLSFLHTNSLLLSLSISQSLSQLTCTHQTQKKRRFSFFLFLFLLFYRKISKWIAFLYFSLFACWFSFAAIDSLSFSRENVNAFIYFSDWFLGFFFCSDKSAFLKNVISFFLVSIQLDEWSCVSFRLISEWYFFLFYFLLFIVFSSSVHNSFNENEYCHRHKWMIW